ncbi:hypothetical protein [Streptomyces sp. NPDC003006]
MGRGAQVAEGGFRITRAGVDVGPLDQAAAVRNGAGEGRGEMGLRGGEVTAVRGRAAQPVQRPRRRGPQPPGPLELRHGRVDITGGKPHTPHPGTGPSHHPPRPPAPDPTTIGGTAPVTDAAPAVTGVVTTATTGA